MNQLTEKEIIEIFEQCDFKFIEKKLNNELIFFDSVNSENISYFIKDIVYPKNLYFWMWNHGFYSCEQKIKRINGTSKTS